MLRLAIKIVGISVAALCAVPLALAAGGSLSGVAYGGSGGNIQASAVGGVKSATTLPFTGLSLTFIAVLGLVLLGTGILLRRNSSTR